MLGGDVVRTGYFVFWYGCAAAVVGGIAQVASFSSGWSLTNAAGLVALISFMVSASIARELVWSEENWSPLFAVTPARMVFARTLLVLLVTQLAYFVLAYGRGRSEWALSGLFTSTVVFVNVLLTAMRGLGLDAAVGQPVAWLLRLPQRFWLGLAGWEQKRALRRYRQARREARGNRPRE